MSLRTGDDDVIALEDTTADAQSTWTRLQFRVANIVGAALAVALAAAILLASQEYAFRVGALPGPAFFPVIIGVALLGLSVGWLVMSVLGRYRVEADTEPPPDRSALLRALASLGVVAVSAFTMQPLGYPLTVAVAVTVLTLLARGRLRAAIPTGIGFAVVSFLLVTTVLGVQLPTGVLRPLLVGLL